MKTSELTRAALNWAVAKCVYPDLVWGSSIGVHHASHQIVIPHLPEPKCYYDPSTEWAQGGPIIEAWAIDVDTYRGAWRAARHVGILPTYGYGPTPLIAAMRCYVASKLGDEIELPTELGESK